MRMRFVLVSFGSQDLPYSSSNNCSILKAINKDSIKKPRLVINTKYDLLRNTPKNQAADKFVTNPDRTLNLKETKK